MLKSQSNNANHGLTTKEHNVYNMSSYEQLITFGVLSAPKLTQRNRFSLAFGRLYINHDGEAKTTGSSMSIHAKLIFWCSKMNEFEQN